LRKPVGGGGSWPGVALGAVTGEPISVSAGAATSWLTPDTPATMPLSEAGIDSAESASRSDCPDTLYVPRVVPKAASTCCAVPLADTKSLSDGAPVTVKPSERSQLVAALTLAAEGAYAAVH
jgi:hypothetical protein